MVTQTFEWIIVGAGLHGVHLAQCLLGSGVVKHRDLRIIDPHPTPLATWQRQTRATGMQTLRSPAAHHLQRDARALLHFAEQKNLQQQLHGRYRRPSLNLFNQHCEQTIQTSGLGDCLIQDWIESIEIPNGDQVNSYSLKGKSAQWQAHKVILALGPAPPKKPAWAAQLPHIFEPQFDAQFDARALPTDAPVHIIGGGLSAAQLALNLSERGGQPTLITRRPLQVQDFDSDPCYLGPKCLREFHSTTNLQERQTIIAAARQPGTVPESVYDHLMAMQRANKLNIICDTATGIRGNDLQLASGRQITAERIVLATGFSGEAPGGSLVSNLADTYALPVSNGIPITNYTLEWRSGLFVTGRLAELELGPAAGNIAGARMAGKRLLDYLSRD